jgi:hypothetical protein
MKTFGPLVLWLFLMIPALLPAQEPPKPSAKEQKIDRLLVAMNAQAVLGQIFEQIRTESMGEMPKNATFEQAVKFKAFQDKLMELVQTRLSWERLRPVYLKLYDETFTEEELDGMIAFYESPPGRAMMKKMPILGARTMQVTQKLLSDLMPEMEKLAREMAK